MSACLPSNQDCSHGQLTSTKETNYPALSGTFQRGPNGPAREFRSTRLTMVGLGKALAPGAQTDKIESMLVEF
jgi:hypothetical protein